MGPNVPKIGPRMCINGLDGFVKNGHKMALSLDILGQILAILRISAQKNDQPFLGGKSLPLKNSLFDLKIGIASSLQWF